MVYLYYYSFGSTLNDYPKLGVWPSANDSAYFASYNLVANGNNLIGADLCAYDRVALLAGTSATQICFLVSNDSGFLPRATSLRLDPDQRRGDATAMATGRLSGRGPDP